ncbi:MAG: hypothetical protein ACKO8I_02535 [Cyanobacteriota bacterium]
MPEAVRALWADPVAAWLVPRGFRAEEGHALRWERDPMASQRLLLQERDQAQARVQDLEAQLQQLRNHHEALQTINVQQRQQLDSITRELDDILAVMDQEITPSP